MTREEELELLIEEQRKDDEVRTVYPEPGHPRGTVIVPLDRGLSDQSDDTLIDRICGIEYDLEDGDDVGHIVTFIGQTHVAHGHALMQREHGTMNGYKNQGCRCSRCRAANTAYLVPKMRKRRKAEQGARPDRVCASATCDNKFRPVPSTKMFCSQRCAWREGKRRERERVAA